MGEGATMTTGNLNIQESKRAQRGQGMTEYIIIVALIAVAAIGAYGLFGQTVRTQVAGMANELTGKSAAADITVGKAAGASASGLANTKVNLGDYNTTASTGAK
jgi:Flp pilus assembly pilin Flp